MLALAVVLSLFATGASAAQVKGTARAPQQNSKAKPKAKPAPQPKPALASKPAHVAEEPAAKLVVPPARLVPRPEPVYRPAPAPRPTWQYKLRVDGEAGWHLFGRQDLATHRYSAEFEQRVAFPSRWTLVAGGRGVVDGAYAMNSGRYSGAVVRDESSEFLLRDLYAQFKGGSLFLRVGNQQVVWGETFGFFYADIVNPKDLRTGVPRDLASARIPVPMVNAKLIGSSNSIQFLYIPYPLFNRLPNQGGDFFTARVPGVSLTVDDPRKLPFSLGNWEAGVRGTQLVGGVDLSVFFLKSFDRQPNFRAELTSLVPPALTLKAVRNRVQTAGITATMDIASVLVRLEALQIFDRRFDVFDGGVYRSVKSKETIAVLEADYGGLKNWRFALQGAYDAISEDIPGLLSPRRHSMSAQVTRTLANEQTLEALWAHIPSDKSSFVRFAYVNPFSNSLELRLGTDLFLGNAASQYGSLREASRGTLSLRVFLGG
ncbi:MAG: hypothetical protein NDJ90_03690 [Oligoflexia bacterium]|nr:hypothetical protein [Oligoflexia bacterium]